MLSEIMYASTKVKVDPTRTPGLSSSGLFPCPYRMYMVHTGQFYPDNPDPQAILNMEDGNTHEDQVVERIESSGVKIENRQKRLKFGRSGLTGRPDGSFNLVEEEYIWEFKAMNDYLYSEFVKWGLKTFPNYQCQVQSYMHATGIHKACFHAKNKNDNAHHDIIIEYDPEFILPIIEWADKIRLGEVTPEPIQIPECAHCGFGCFGQALDFSWMETADEVEMSEQWRKGNMFKKGGEAMMEEAKAFFSGVFDKYGNLLRPGLIGDKESLMVNGLSIKKVVAHGFQIDRQKIIEEFGPEGLIKVGESTETVSYRIRETT
ncbi:hypothetical protein LCGC14_0894280 [marine sediment metagenome]|uniref:YqaJ viral recombinase domain-containing protein n=1 Tax=marine sediment metagenome TaxID=412755 RepID=A0A0F9S584_9ZZZZ